MSNKKNTSWNMSKSISPILAISFHSLICLYWLFKQGGAMRDSGRWRARQLWSEMKLGREGCHGDQSWLSPQDESFDEQVGKSNTIDNQLPETASQPLLVQCHVGRLTVPQRSLSLGMLWVNCIGGRICSGTWAKEGVPRSQGPGHFL